MAEVKTQNDLDFERKHEEDLRRIRDFRLMDDNFMSKVFEDKPCAEFLLRIILNRDDLKVKEVHGQHDLNNIQGRSVRLDILAVDHENRAYNVEVQRSDSGAVAKRARYNSSIIDANILDALRKMRKEWQRCAEQLRNCAMKQGMKRSLRMRLSFSDRVS